MYSDQFKSGLRALITLHEKEKEKDQKNRSRSIVDELRFHTSLIQAERSSTKSKAKSNLHNNNKENFYPSAGLSVSVRPMAVQQFKNALAQIDQSIVFHINQNTETAAKKRKLPPVPLFNDVPRQNNEANGGTKKLKVNSVTFNPNVSTVIIDQKELKGSTEKPPVSQPQVAQPTEPAVPHPASIDLQHSLNIIVSTPFTITAPPTPPIRTSKTKSKQIPCVSIRFLRKRMTRQTRTPKGLFSFMDTKKKIKRKKTTRSDQ